MHTLLYFDGPLDPALRGIRQTRRERLQPREVIGARCRSTSERRVTFGAGGERNDPTHSLIDARDRRGVLIGPRCDRRRPARHKRLEVGKSTV